MGLSKPKPWSLLLPNGLKLPRFPSNCRRNPLPATVVSVTRRASGTARPSSSPKRSILAMVSSALNEIASTCRSTTSGRNMPKVRWRERT